MKKLLYLLLWILAGAATAQAQRLSSADSALLIKQQDSLVQLADKILNGKTEDVRQQSSDQFIPLLVRTLRAPYSFRFRFDSLQSISIQYPQDSSFRIFTWAVENETTFY